MPDEPTPTLLPRLPTGIAGFDDVSQGGLPANSVTLVAGTAGSGKTVLALQFLAEGVRRFGQPGVFVTFGEPARKLRWFTGEFAWEVPAWELDGRWTFIESAPGPEDKTAVVGGHFDLTVLLNGITEAVERTGAQRVAIDSLNVLFARFEDSAAVRDGLVRITSRLERLGVTAVMTIGRDREADHVTPMGVEEYVADNLIILRNELEEETRRRTLEVLKFRGTRHRQGKFPFAITREQGIVVIPLSAQLDQPTSSGRISSGIPAFDEMCGGGLFQDAVTLVSGSTGTGKTSVAMQFALEGAQQGEPALVVGFEESRDQMLRAVSGWPYDVAALEADGKLRFLIDYPEVRTFEEHLVHIQGAVEDLGATRLVLDSLTSLRRGGPERSFREFTIGLTAYLKQREVSGLLTTGQASLAGQELTATQEHVSSLTDAIVMLRYIEVYGELKRGITVLKVRGSGHDKTIREYTIGPNGIEIGSPLRTTTGIMSGRPSQLDATESARLTDIFPTAEQ
jgi:circadian clock protein KaiC